MFAAAAALLLCAFLFLPLSRWVVGLLAWSSGLGGWTAAVLVAVWIPAAVLLVPGTLLTLGTGFLLGLPFGVATVSAGSTLGAAAAFLVGRRLGRPWVAARVADRPRLLAIDRAVAREGLRVVLLTRLSPLFPYNALNYALSGTGVRFRDFLLGSWIGMLPGTVLYVYLGSGARTLAAVVTDREGLTKPEIALFALGLAATIGAAILVSRAAGRALAERVPADGPA